MSRKLILALTAAACLGATPVVFAKDAAPAAYVSAAVADAGRPEADKARDAARKPAEMLAFAEVKPGQKVLEIIPGGGYFTRLLSKAVGPTGKVYAAAAPGNGVTQLEPVTKDATYSNVQVIAPPLRAGATVPEPVDVIFTAQNYHDLHLAQLKLDVPAANKALFDALKPGGILLVIDHAAVAGAPLTVADSLHRIDPAVARAEIEAAGFQYVGESDVIRNPADPKTANVFDAAIRGKTDQFVYKFKKPG
ncbi:MAG TPA: methyltransferase [Phenylobacterium sp.]